MLLTRVTIKLVPEVKFESTILAEAAETMIFGITSSNVVVERRVRHVKCKEDGVKGSADEYEPKPCTLLIRNCL